MSRLRRNDQCWCGGPAKHKRCHGAFERPRFPVVKGTVAPARRVPRDIERPWYITAGATDADRAPAQIVDDEDDLQRLRAACRAAAEVLAHVGAHVRAGVTTDDLDELAHEAYLARGAYPSTLGYQGFTKSICTSVNEVVCHGIGDDRPLREGDIVNVDVTAYLAGMHGDTSATYVVGRAGDPVTALVDTTREATMRGIGALVAGGPLAAVGDAVEALAAARGFGVVAEFGGHGIGRHFHAAPHVDHVRNRGRVRLVEGMVLTVEPMLTAGSPALRHWDDGWTVVTADLLPSAQFEHTVLVHRDGAEVLTAPVGSPVHPAR